MRGFPIKTGTSLFAISSQRSTSPKRGDKSEYYEDLCGSSIGQTL